MNSPDGRYDGPFGWVEAVKGVMDFVELAGERYLDDLLVNTVVDDATVKYDGVQTGLPDSCLEAYGWDWDGLVVVRQKVFPCLPPSILNLQRELAGDSPTSSLSPSVAFVPESNSLR